MLEFGGESQGKGLLGRRRCRYENNIKMNPKEIA
jgi:hypothetical protein